MGAQSVCLEFTFCISMNRQNGAKLGAQSACLEFTFDVYMNRQNGAKVGAQSACLEFKLGRWSYTALSYTNRDISNSFFWVTCDLKWSTMSSTPKEAFAKRPM